MRKGKVTARLKIIILTLFVFVLIGMIILYPYRFSIINRITSFINTGKLISTSAAPCESCNVLFTDGIYAHEVAYKRERINIQKNGQGLLKLESKGILERIHTNEFYVVRDMDFSDPLLMAKAVNLLTKLSKIYKGMIDELELRYIPFEITSATRTLESVQRLKKDNVNAIKNSAHLKGKTFDVSYINFADYPEQRVLFIKALKLLKDEKQCYVKFEVAQKCFHITAH